MNEDPSSRPAAADATATPPPAQKSDRPQGEGGVLGRLSRLFRNRTSLRDDLETALSAEIEDGHTFTPEERTLLRNILRLREIRVEDVMVPRADIEAVEASVTLVGLIHTFRTSGHSRMPVYRESLDDAIGMVHIKDLMTYIAVAAAPLDVDGTLDLTRVDLSRSLDDSGLVRPVLFVPPSMPATDLMAKMQAARVQMALVIDEYGGTDGLVSLEDIVETVVGDIEDEHDDDEDEPALKSAGDGVWVADARVDLDAVREAIGESFELGPLAEEVDTLGGLVYALVGRIPVRGELIAPASLPGFEFEVMDADPRRIRKLRIFRRNGDEPRRRPIRREPATAAEA